MLKTNHHGIKLDVNDLDIMNKLFYSKNDYFNDNRFADMKIEETLKQ